MNDFQGMRGLSVDDEKPNLLLVESMAEDIGLAMDSFTSPVAALEAIREKQYDLILVDYIMPHVNGVELIQQIREHQPDVPIIMITGVCGDDDLKLAAFEAGATEFLNKPINIAEFRARVMNLARLRKSQLLLKDRALLLEDEVKRATSAVVDREYETLSVLSRAAEYRDPETGSHIARVARYSRLIAEKLGLDEDTRELVLYAAPLHDIGKIGVGDSILLKPGKLTAAEFESMKSHATIGHRIIRDAKSQYLQAGAIVSLYHHERHDGTGYPAGVAGEDIHLLGRIVAIADVFDALTSRRPYKEPWPFDRAMAHLGAQRGKHFDPELVDHFLSGAERVREIFDSFAGG